MTTKNGIAGLKLKEDIDENLNTEKSLGAVGMICKVLCCSKSGALLFSCCSSDKSASYYNKESGYDEEAGEVSNPAFCCGSEIDNVEEYKSNDGSE